MIETRYGRGKMRLKESTSDSTTGSRSAISTYVIAREEAQVVRTSAAIADVLLSSETSGRVLLFLAKLSYLAELRPVV